jgi:RHS repeat-associated protein
VLTNQWGSYHERIEYFPYGEVWVEDRADKEGYTTPYKFTGKELDKETGLYYFGARYYDARVGRWVSADPALEKYLLKRISDKEEDDNNSQEEISKSLKISSRLYLYAFTMNNPIVYIDPDGYDDFYFTIINKVGILFYRDDKGNKLWSVPANSGIDEGLNNPSMQAVPNKGPIMEGNYKVDLTNKAKPDKTVADGKGWGMFGWKLNESFMGKLVRKFSSSRGGGFYLHQDMYKGNKKGTAGCIGVIGSKNIQKIKQTLEKLSKNNSSVEVIVRYPKHNTKETK